MNKLLTSFILILAPFATGCVSVLNNTALSDIEGARTARLKSPTCVGIKLRIMQRDSSGNYSYKVASPQSTEENLNGLSYYNIFTNCPKNIKEITLDFEYNESNALPVALGATAHFLTLGMIPLWNDERKMVFVSDEKGPVLQREIRIEKFAWTGNVVGWNRDQTKSLKEFGVPLFEAEPIRQLAILIIDSLKARGDLNE